MQELAYVAFQGCDVLSADLVLYSSHSLLYGVDPVLNSFEPLLDRH